MSPSESKCIQVNLSESEWIQVKPSPSPQSSYPTLGGLIGDIKSSKEDSIKVVESPVLIPTFKKEDYWGVEGFGDVIESNLSWNKEVMRKKVGHLFCHMTGVWKYSDNGIDWTPIREEFAEEFKAVA